MERKIAMQIDTETKPQHHEESSVSLLKVFGNRG